MTLGSNSPESNLSLGADEDMALRSAPAQKAPPAPVRMTARTESSALARSQAPDISASISAERALRASGRFIVTVRTCPSCSTRQCGSVPVGLAVRLSVMRTTLVRNWNVF